MLLLKELRMQKGLTQTEVAARLQLSRQTYNNYESGKREPDIKTLIMLANFYGVTLDFLTSNPALPSTKKAQGVKIPVLGKVTAGIPIEAVTEILDYEEIPESLARSGDYFALRITGDSMTPRICPGDVVIVRKQEAVDNGDLAIVLVNGDAATIKEVRRSQFGLTLIGWNVAVYPPRFYTVDEVENLPVRIIGKVVELRGKF